MLTRAREPKVISGSSTWVEWESNRYRRDIKFSNGFSIANFNWMYHVARQNTNHWESHAIWLPIVIDSILLCEAAKSVIGKNLEWKIIKFLFRVIKIVEKKLIKRYFSIFFLWAIWIISMFKKKIRFYFILYMKRVMMKQTCVSEK